MEGECAQYQGDFKLAAEQLSTVWSGEPVAAGATGWELVGLGQLTNSLQTFVKQRHTHRHLQAFYRLLGRILGFKVLPSTPRLYPFTGPMGGAGQWPRGSVLNGLPLVLCQQSFWFPSPQST